MLYSTRMTIYVVAEGDLMNKPFHVAYVLIKDMAQSNYEWRREHILIEKTQPKGGMYKVSNFDHMNVKVDAIYQKLDNLSITLAVTVADVCNAQDYFQD